ncbi:hypothetical protein [Clostridium formicaceticum]|uniref:Uncharacterized protein n=1 Tax=Clostridium formicaceticum TaxID=1497 RepID=A0AAC9RS36_9CLOT|nr:hypothetical protein [Clostridium formicaceticum]AOY74748.1 hypothetical protein BJL90_01525 [Clostridium formicaceticum]ARE89135.1 hypothetical protein CLFO_35410 [Clostridium formicaceticum]
MLKKRSNEVRYTLNVQPIIFDIVIHGKMNTSQLGLFSMFIYQNEVSFTLDDLKRMSPVDTVEEIETNLYQLALMGYVKQM